MYDITLPTSTLPIMGYMENNDYFNEHLAAWEQEVLTKLESLKYPLDLWPSSSESRLGFIRHWKGTGKPRTMAPLDMQLDKSPYTGSPMPASVEHMFKQSFELATEASFCITRGEDWWPHDKTFAIVDANSYMQGVQYLESVRAGELLEVKQVERHKTPGRPKNLEAKQLRLEKTQRYRQWLIDCEVYKNQLNELKAAYTSALKAYSDYKEQGAPKWNG